MGLILLSMLVVAGALSVRLVAVDLAEHRLPNRLVGGLFVCGLVVAAIRVIDDGWPISFILFGTLGFGIPFLLLNLLRPVALGFGDVKLAFALGLLLGAFAPAAVSWALAIVVVVVLVLPVALGPRLVPFGPILVTAALISVGPSLYNYVTAA